MRYKRFEIKNFKGIEYARVDMPNESDARVITLVGLNESGKTTVLEAIHSFEPDSGADTVTGKTRKNVRSSPLAVPRSKLSYFTGEVSITAHLDLDDQDKDRIGEFLQYEYSLHIDLSQVPNTFTYERLSEYRNGSLVGNFVRLGFSPLVKSVKQRKFRSPAGKELQQVQASIREILPTIAYFPTFVFDFPERIYLSSRRADLKNHFYRMLFQDILDHGEKGFTIKDHITQRVRKEEFRLNWAGFFTTFRRSTEWEQIDQVIAHAARTVSQIVYSKWNEIFSEDPGNKEIVISWDVEEGRPTKEQEEAGEVATEHDVFVQFRVKDGADTFPIETRSLGFRWFFSFLLFTQFRAARSSGLPIVFLLDSNPHQIFTHQHNRS